jgi:hypothetical protein
MSAFGGKADMTISACPLLRSLLGVKQTWPIAVHMSAYDPKRTSLIALHMSAFGSEADISRTSYGIFLAIQETGGVFTASPCI